MVVRSKCNYLQTFRKYYENNLRRFANVGKNESRLARRDQGSFPSPLCGSTRGEDASALLGVVAAVAVLARDLAKV